MTVATLPKVAVVGPWRREAAAVVALRTTQLAEVSRVCPSWWPNVVPPCDAVYRCPGESAWAQAVTESAALEGIPVFHSLSGLYEWLEGVHAMAEAE